MWGRESWVMSASKARSLVKYSQCEVYEYLNCYLNYRMMRYCKITVYLLLRLASWPWCSRGQSGWRSSSSKMLSKTMINISMCEGDGIDVIMEGQCTHFEAIPIALSSVLTALLQILLDPMSPPHFAYSSMILV